MDDYILVLVHVDRDHVDVAGNEYPIEGYVETKEFTNDLDLQYGLSGVPWGKTVGFPYDNIKEGRWFVLKTQVNDDFTIIDTYYNQAKFKNGFILYNGTIRQCARFIVRNKNDIEQNYNAKALSIKEEEIAGSKEWVRNYNALCMYG